MVALSDINTVTSQFIYQAWGIEMPTLQELTAPFQPIVEMLCPMQTLCQPQACVELAVTESSSPGFWLNEASITTLLHAGLIENHQKLFSGLLSRFRLWGPWPCSDGERAGGDCEDSEAEVPRHQGIESTMSSSSVSQQVADAEGTPAPSMFPGSTCPVADSSIAKTDFRNSTYTSSSSCTRPPDVPGSPTASSSLAMRGVEQELEELTITDNLQLITSPCKGGSDVADTEHSVTSSKVEDDDSDDNADADYWQWDPEKERYRHWEETDQVWAYFPEIFH